MDERSVAQISPKDLQQQEGQSMKKTAVICSLMLAGGVVLGVIGDRVLNAKEDPVKSTLLIKTTVAGAEEKEARVVLVEFAPERLFVGNTITPGTRSSMYSTAA